MHHQLNQQLSCPLVPNGVTSWQWGYFSFITWKYFWWRTTKLLGGIVVSVRLSARPSDCPSRILCPLCSAYSFGWIHFIFHIYTSYQATSECVSCVKFLAKFQSLNFWQFFKIGKFDSGGWGGGGCGGLSQNAGVLVVLVSTRIWKIRIFFCWMGFL